MTSHYPNNLGASDARQENIKKNGYALNAKHPREEIKLQTEEVEGGRGKNTLKANFIVSRVFAGLHTTDKAITYSLMSMQLSSCWKETKEKS